MLRTRVIPALLLRNESLVKTIRYGEYQYIGDPCNTVRIFNELEVDELLFLDITATRECRTPNLKVLRDIADECFMPVAYGGGIQTMEQAKQVFDIGIEKVAVNSHAIESPHFVSELAERYGSQAVICSIDVKRSLLGANRVYRHSIGRNTSLSPVDWARKLEALGAGEILLTAIDREGTWRGFDVQLVKAVSSSVSIPVIAHGGAGSVDHIFEVVKEGGASAVALGSMVVFQKKGMGVLVNFPSQESLLNALA
jgi:cyclase